MRPSGPRIFDGHPEINSIFLQDKAMEWHWSQTLEMLETFNNIQVKKSVYSFPARNQLSMTFQIASPAAIFGNSSSI